MAGSRETIFELVDKISTLAEAMHRLEKIDAPSRSEFAKLCGIKQKSLTSACNAGGLTISMQKAIAEKVGFDRDHRTWIDRNVPAKRRHDTGFSGLRMDKAINFRNYLLPLLGLSGSPRYRLVPRVPATISPDLASVALTDYGQTTPEGSDIHAHLQASLHIGYLEDGFAYGFERFAVRIRFTHSDLLEVNGRLAEKEPVLLEGVEATCHGTSMDPYWKFSINHSVFDQEISTATGDEPLIKIRPWNIPAEMKVELAVHPHDGTLIAIPPNQMTSNNKSRVIERLMLKMLSDDIDASGSLILSRQVVGILQVKDD